MSSGFEIVSYLARQLRGSVQIAHQPDHPYLLMAPNVLIGGDGKLTGIFFLRRSTSASELAARISAARLALPIKGKGDGGIFRFKRIILPSPFLVGRRVPPYSVDPVAQ